jgi:hypothetical protein
VPLLDGSFLIAFDDERAALDAARASRKNSFPADERDRYASRLKRICEPLGGRYDRFVRG